MFTFNTTKNAIPPAVQGRWNGGLLTKVATLLFDTRPLLLNTCLYFSPFVSVHANYLLFRRQETFQDLPQLFYMIHVIWSGDYVRTILCISDRGQEQAQFRAV